MSMKKYSVCVVFLCLVSVLIMGCFPEKSSAAQAAGNSVQLPVLMYHNILNNSTGTYIVSEGQLNDDLTALKKAGYVTVFPSEIIAYVHGEGSLPDKPVLITFDDGYYNNMHYALPVLRKHGAKALLNVIGAFTNFSTTSGDDSNPNYSHVTWGQVSELSASGVFEIGNHTYNMHKYKPRYGIARKKGENDAQYIAALRSDIGRLQDKLKDCCGAYPSVFAYPFGKITEEAKAVTAELGFSMLLTCSEGINTLTVGDPSCLLSIKRFNRAGEYTTPCFINKFSKQT